MGRGDRLGWWAGAVAVLLLAVLLVDALSVSEQLEADHELQAMGHHVKKRCRSSAACHQKCHQTLSKNATLNAIAVSNNTILLPPPALPRCADLDHKQQLHFCLAGCGARSNRTLEACNEVCRLSADHAIAQEVTHLHKHKGKKDKKKGTAAKTLTQKQKDKLKRQKTQMHDMCSYACRLRCPPIVLSSARPRDHTIPEALRG